MRKKNLMLTLLIALTFLLFTPVINAKAATLTEDQKKFIGSIEEDAITNYKDHNILPSLTIAQAILESSWGKSTLATKGNNLFGVKAYSDWTGSSISLSTKEFVKGKYIYTSAKFKSYSTLCESINDHSILLSCERYSSVRSSKNYKEACYAIYKCGYATAPTYPQSLIEIIDCFELYKYDIKASIPDEKASSNAPGKTIVVKPKLIFKIIPFRSVGYNTI